LNWGSNNLIIQPLISLLKILPVSEARILNVKKGHLVPMDSYDSGTNILFAYNLMMWTLTCFILTFGILTVHLINDPEFGKSFTIMFWTSVTISIIINYMTLWKSDRYKKYLRQFKKEKRTSKDYFFAIAYHSTITASCIVIALYILNE
jgi:hypothetical protein